MKVSCSSCSAKYTIADEKVMGRIVKIRCKKCGATIVVNGNDMAASAAPAGAHDGDSWTVSVDDNDQRTMSTAEIAAAFNSGTLNEETFVWKEGMADWQALAEVSVLADAVGLGGQQVGFSAPPPADDGGGLFGSSLGGSGGGDLGGLGSGGDIGLGGGGLFGEATVAAQAPSASAGASAARRAGGRAGGDLFSGAATAGGEEEVMTSAPGLTPPPTGDTKLTGQRNENSVLFSLNALTANAPSTTKDETTAQGDASGLIDIRALSSSMNKPAETASKVDDIMNLGGGGLTAGFSTQLAAPALNTAPAAGFGVTPSLVPEAPPPSNNKGLMIGLIALGVCILAAALVVVLVLKDGPDEQLARYEQPQAGNSTMLPADPAPTTPPASQPDPTPEPTAVASATPPSVGTPSSNSGGSSSKSGGGSAPFDRGAASAALSGVNVSSCKKGEGGNGHVKVTFAPNGSVSAAAVDGGPFQGTAVGGCVAAKYRGARVPAFSGGPVTVGKSFTIR